MGTWGSGILDDDVARDVHDRYLEAHAAGEPDDSIVEALRGEFAGVVSDPDEGPIFWLAVAHAQWDCSSVSPEVRERVEQIVAEGLGLARWAEAGRAQLARRKAALSRFLKNIGTPPTRAATRAARTLGIPFQVGDCLAIDLGNGQFAAAVVTKYLPGASASHILSVLDYLETAPPGRDVFSAPSWLRVTDPPNLTIVKYSVYADGYQRHKARYKVVCRIDLDEVPPPLTLGLGNWGNVWRDLSKRLGPKSTGSGRAAG